MAARLAFSLHRNLLTRQSRTLLLPLAVHQRGSNMTTNNQGGAPAVGTKSTEYRDAADKGTLSWAPPGEDVPLKSPVPPFTAETALQKVKAAEDAWNSRDPVRVSGAYSVDTVWRNRDEFITGREEVQAFLTRKWAGETDYKLKKHLWSFTDNRIAVRFEYEYRRGDQWYRAHGNELWEFDAKGYMRWRDMSANDVPIAENERRL